MTQVTGAIITRRLASLFELQTVYSYEDALDMFEVISVNNHNERAMMEVSRNGRN